MRQLGLIFILFLWSCAPPKPILVFESKIVGDGGRLVREIYRRSWTLPASDQDLIQIGLVPSETRIRFKALHRMKVRALGESSSWEVASPEGVRWVIETQGTARPQVVSYFSVVESDFFEKPPISSHFKVQKWKERGFISTRWIGPPKMDVNVATRGFDKWMVSVTSPTSEKMAQKKCVEIKKHFPSSNCSTVARIEIPPMARGKIWAENSSFSQDFEGFIELISLHGPVEIEDLSQDVVTDSKSSERYGPRLLVIPTIDGKLSLIQQTSLQNYLDSVVSSEIFPSAPIEALKAQAIVARTYTLRYGKPEYVSKPFFICAGTKCQAYRGVDAKHVGPSKAVEDTANQVLFDVPGHLASTYYHSICGGHTDSRNDIFHESSTSYLKGVTDTLEDEPLTLKTDSQIEAYLAKPAVAFCGLSKLTLADRWRWNAKFDEDQIEEILSQINLQPPLLDIQVLKRGVSGRVLSLKIKTKEKIKNLDGELAIRKFFGGLRSAQFFLEKKMDGEKISNLLIYGGAGGHGVGMCQMGAIGRAERGQTSEQILKTYFPGTFVDDLSKLVVK